MRRQAAVGFLALGIAAAVSGCGGSSSYSLKSTEACFNGKGLKAVPLANRYLPGSGGNLRVALGKNYGYLYVYMVFDHSHTDAVATETKAVNLALASFKKKNLVMSRADVLAGVELNRNVFYYSNSGAIPQNVNLAVQQCLS
jgi:hypothetical protein